MSVIAVVNAGAVDDEASSWSEEWLGELFACETRRLPSLPDPDFAYDTARNQYSSTLILRDALPRRPADAVRMFVLTECDIFIPMLSFVYGQAQLDGALAVLSFARLRQEFYGLPANRLLFLRRVRKEVLHEAGHTLGLTHCEDPLCTMRLSTTIQQLDSKRDDFCDTCAVLLRDAVAAAAGAATVPSEAGGSR